MMLEKVGTHYLPLYRVTNQHPVGHYTVRPGQLVYINDTTLFTEDEPVSPRDADVQLQFFIDTFTPALLSDPAKFSDLNSDLTSNLVTGYAASFGGDLSLNQPSSSPPLRLLDVEGLPVHHEKQNRLGCFPYARTYTDTVLLVHRGNCTFLEKLTYARDAAAAGVIVISNDDTAINPTASTLELATAGNITSVAIVFIPKTSSQVILEMMDMAEKLELGPVRVALDPPREVPPSTPLDTGHGRAVEEVRDPNRILYVNGYPLLNTRLLI